MQLLVAYAITGIGLVSWLLSRDSSEEPVTWGYCVRVLIRLASVFVLLWYISESMQVSALKMLGVVALFTALGIAAGNILAAPPVMMAACVLLYVLWIPPWSMFVLEPQQDEPLPESTRDAIVGQTGITRSVLRPIGNVEIEGKLYEAATEDGQYIEPGATVVVLDKTAGRLIVALHE